MNEFKGSPAPWVTLQNGFAQCAVKDARGIWLTYRAGDSNRLSNEEVEANARVMAAAPELLEALEEIVNAPNIGGKGGLHKARAAIAKARGAA